MSTTSQRLTLTGSAGKLEAMLELPADFVSAGSIPAAAVVCHPHPQYQGTMLNKVVHTLARSATDCGMPSLRFNYRGVGKSEGHYDAGTGETDDAQVACNELIERYAPQQMVVMGFSFGSGVALRLAQRPFLEQSLAAVVTTAPPVGRLGVPERVNATCPWLVVQGTADELVDADEVKQWVGRQQPQPELFMMDEVSHFFHGNLTDLRRRVVEFLKRAVRHL